MSARSVFEAMTPLVGPLLERDLNRRDLCILATRVAIDVAEYFGIHATAVPVKAMIYNAPFARHKTEGFAGVDTSNVAGWGDDSYSVGIGFGAPPRHNGWDGHLIAVADGWFADCSIWQAERPAFGIVLPPALVGPWTPPAWKAARGDGEVTVEYWMIDDDRWRMAPDWRERKGDRRKLVGEIIREIKATTSSTLRTEEERIAQ